MSDVTPTPDDAAASVNPFAGAFDQAVVGSTPGAAQEEKIPAPLGGGSEREPTTLNQPFTPRERRRAWEPYRRGEENDPERWPIEEVIALQRHLDALGLLSGPYRVGHWDARSAAAYGELLGFANQIGGKTVAFPEVVRQYGELQLQEPVDERALAGVESFMAPTFRPPSPEAVAQALNQTWEQSAGRPPDAAEAARFSAEWQRLAREAHRVETGVARGEFERQQEQDLARISQETGIPVEALRPAQDPNAPAALPADTPQTDPQAEFDALVESHLAPEVEGQEQAADAAQSNRLVSGVFADIGRLMQQGGVG